MTDSKQGPTTFTIEFTDPATGERVKRSGSPTEVISAMSQSLDASSLKREIGNLSLLLQRQKELDAKRMTGTQENAEPLNSDSEIEKSYPWPKDHIPLTVDSFIELMREHGQGKFFIDEEGCIRAKDSSLTPLSFECVRRGLCQIGDPYYGGGKVRSFCGAIDFVLIPVDGYSSELPRGKVRSDILNSQRVPGHPVRVRLLAALGLTETMPIPKEPPVKHGDKVKYVGVFSDEYVRRDEIYTVFGYDSRNPDENGVLDKSRPTQREESISIYVDDPKDDFGGVLSYRASAFQIIT